MKPRVLNRICAHPIALSWLLGALALNALVLGAFSNEVSLATILGDWRAAGYLFAAVIPISLLGYFLGMFMCWSLLRIACSRFNGAPLKVGDRVVILSGPRRGDTVVVYEITVGQGGWHLARLDLGAEHRKRFSDIFEEYSVMKMGGGGTPPPDAAGSGTPTAPAPPDQQQRPGQVSKKANPLPL